MISSIVAVKTTVRVPLEMKSAILPVNQQMVMFPGHKSQRNGIKTDPVVKSTLILVKELGKNESQEVRCT